MRGLCRQPLYNSDVKNLKSLSVSADSSPGSCPHTDIFRQDDANEKPSDLSLQLGPRSSAMRRDVEV